jgi:protease I
MADSKQARDENKMANKLDGKKVAILAADFFEQVELTKPRDALKEAGAEVKIVSLKAGRIQGMHHADKGDKVEVDLTLDQADPEEFDALMIPGGTMNPDTLRSTPAALDFTRHFFQAGKPAAVICHGPWVLIDAGLARGRKLTSWPAIQMDLKNAGAEWVDQEVVVDNGLVTSRKPDDIPAFNRKKIEEFAEGKHQARNAPAREERATVKLET